MKQKLTSLTLLVLMLTFCAAACGDNASEVGTASGADEPISVESGVDESDTGGDSADPLPEQLSEEQQPEEIPMAESPDEEVITDFEPVDGKVTTPTEVVLNPENPSELWIRFVGGAQPCTAATATIITETPEEVVVELVVGITSDALVKSCLAGEFNLRLDVALREPATNKSLSWASAPEPTKPIQVTPDLTTDDFVGLTEDEAAALANQNAITYRVVRIDGESFVVTMDHRPSRMNFEIDDGVVTAVAMG